MFCEFQWLDILVDGYIIMITVLFTGQVFDGNSDQQTVVCNQLATPVFAQYFRIQPKTWNEHIAMRLELHGCDAGTWQ